MGEAVIGCAPLTTMLTGTTTEVALGAAMVTVPPKVPAVVRTEVTMETLTDPEIVPGAAAGAVSHEPPDVVTAAAVKAIPEVPPIFSVCDAGAAPPMVKVKLSGEGVAVRLLLTTMVTATTCEAAPVAPIVTVPV